jgi:hypothetical protein
MAEMTTEAKGRRELTQHGVLCCLARRKGWLISDLYCDGRAIPPAVTYCAACPAKELLNCDFWQTQLLQAAAASILLNVHKTPI